MSQKGTQRRGVDTSTLTKVVESSTAKGDIKKAKIVEATIKCIAKYGIEKTSFASVGKEAKITKAHVNYYFKEKPDLLKAALEYVLVHAQELTTKHISGIQDTKKLLKAINDVTFEWAKDYPQHIAVLTLMHYYCVVDNDFKKFNTQARKTARARMAAIIGVHRPSLSKQALERLAFSVHALMTGYILEYATSDLGVSIQKHKSDCFEKIELLIKS